MGDGSTGGVRAVRRGSGRWKGLGDVDGILYCVVSVQWRYIQIIFSS
jgi:hypothetical protein